MIGEKQQEREIVFSAEFDDFGSCDKRIKTRVEVVLDACRNVSVEIVDASGIRHELMHAFRDQWGVYLTSHGAVESGPTAPQVAQEDQTRSFLDAMIRALKVLRYYNEFGTKPADVVVGADVEKKAEEASKKDLSDSP